MKTGIELVAEERQRQIDVEGWTPEHDDQHQWGELARAALCYLAVSLVKPFGVNFVNAHWPWELKWWRPKGTIRNLQKAGALIAAEIDRLQRAEKVQE